MTTTLHALLRERDQLILAGAYDAFSARCVEAAGFPCAYLGGGNLTASYLGLPDMGLLSITELEDCVRRVARAVSVPILVDFDTGYGNPFAAAQYLPRLEAAGAAGAHLEDQAEQKRCGHAAGHQVIAPAEMCRKLELARASVSDDFVLVARTDARQVEGLERAITRAHRYVEAGADWIFVEAPETRGELEAIGAAGIGRPLLANLVVGGKTPLLSPAELLDLGFQVVLYAGALLQAAGGAIMRTLRGLAEDGRVAEDTLMTLHERFEVLDHARYTAEESEALRAL